MCRASGVSTTRPRFRNHILDFQQARNYGGGPGGPDPCPFSLKSESALFLGKFETSV